MIRLAIVLSLLPLLLAVPLTAQPQHDTRRTVSVEGEAEVLASPDMATITIGVVSEGKVASDVQRDNSDRIRKVLAAVAKLGIEARDVQTTHVSLEPVYNWRQDGKREFLRYQMRNSVLVTVRDLSKVSNVITIGVDQGGNEVGSISFGLSTMQTLRDSVRIAACKNAQRKAGDMATAVGAKLGKVVTLSESGGWQSPQPMYRAMAMSDEMKSEPIIAAGELRIRVTVSASFELE